MLYRFRKLRSGSGVVEFDDGEGYRTLPLPPGLEAAPYDNMRWGDTSPESLLCAMTLMYHATEHPVVSAAAGVLLRDIWLSRQPWRTFHCGEWVALARCVQAIDMVAAELARVRHQMKRRQNNG